jgi:hypothetical protein
MGYGTTLYRHKVDLEPYAGSSAVGDVFDPPVELRCRFRHKTKVIRTSRGDEVVADAVLECRPAETIAEKDRVTRDGATYRVHEVKPAEALSRTNHLVVLLRAD